MWRQGELTPSRLWEASSRGLCHPGQNRLKDWGGAGKLTGLRAGGQPGYIRLGLGPPRRLPGGPRASRINTVQSPVRLPDEVNTAAYVSAKTFQDPWAPCHACQCCRRAPSTTHGRLPS